MRAARVLLLAVVLASGCATAPARPAAPADQAPAAEDAGGCRPFFRDDSLKIWDAAPEERHSCWNRLWEVPAAILVVPVALAVVAAPIWVPIVLLRR
jgi:hypothetical protein